MDEEKEKGRKNPDTTKISFTISSIPRSCEVE
jgi:hypothetical protein